LRRDRRGSRRSAVRAAPAAGGANLSDPASTEPRGRTQRTSDASRGENERALLTWVDSHGERTSFELDGPEILIGRGHLCRLRDRDDPLLSRQHARLFRSDGTWHVADCGSRNRTVLNGEEIEAPEPILPGDTIRVGRCSVIVEPSPGESIVETIDPSGMEQTVGTLDVSGDRRTGTTHLLVEAARRIASPEPTVEIVESLLGLALRATGAERGLVAMQDGDGALAPVAWHGPEKEGIPRPSRTVLSRVREEGRVLAIRDVEQADDSLRDAALSGSGLRSVLCAPLGTDHPAPGVLYLDRCEGRARFDGAQLQVVAVLAGMIHLALENQEARAHEQRLRAVEAELAAAARMQEMLLPPADLAPPAGFRIAGWHEPCRDIGGDIYDFFESERGFGAMLADVSGKGLTAALLVASLHARWHAITRMRLPCERMLAQLNEEISYRLPPNRFITLVSAVADPHLGEIVYSSAGHGPAFLLRGGEVEQIDSTGPALGLIESATFECQRRPFLRGDVLVLVSDGVFDQCDARGEPFGTERLVERVMQAPAGDPRAMVTAIVEALEEHAGDAEQDDDATIAVLARV